MIIGRDSYIDEDLKLILTVLGEAIDRVWNTKLLRKYAEGDTSVFNSVWEEVVRSEVFQYLYNSSLYNTAIINEFLGGKLLPGVIASTLIAVKSIKDQQLLEGIFAGRTKVAFSDTDLVPAADSADVIIVKDRMAWRDEAEINSYNSLDNSMKVSKVIFKKSQPINFDVNNALVNLASQIVGHAETVVTMSIEYAKNRIAFGKPIGSYQAIKHKLVDDAIAVELARSLYLEASRNPEMAILAKYYASKRLPKVIMDGIQVHGGIGFTDDIDIHLHLRRAITLGKIYYNLKPDVTKLFT